MHEMFEILAQMGQTKWTKSVKNLIISSKFKNNSAFSLENALKINGSISSFIYLQL